MDLLHLAMRGDRLHPTASDIPDSLKLQLGSSQAKWDLEQVLERFMCEKYTSRRSRDILANALRLLLVAKTTGISRFQFIDEERLRNIIKLLELPINSLKHIPISLREELKRYASLSFEVLELYRSACTKTDEELIQRFEQLQVHSDTIMKAFSPSQKAKDFNDYFDDEEFLQKRNRGTTAGGWWSALDARC